MNGQPHPHFLPRLLFKGLWLSPHCGHLACAPRRCLPTPTSEQDCALSFHGRVHHPRLFLSLREVQYTAFWDTGLPRQSLTPLSGHSFVALQTPRRLCYSVSRHPTPRPRFPAGTTLSPPLAALHRPSLLGPPTPAILYRLEIAKHLSAMAILLQLLSHRRPDRLGYLA